MFSLLSEYSTDPLADRDALIDLIAFNYFIGNCDAHLKNYSLLRSADWTELRLAPAYDLVCTSAYEGPTRTLGMRIGGARRLDDVDRASFEELAREIRVAPKMVLARVDELGMRVRDALRIQRSQETEEVEGAEGAEGAEDAEGAERPGAFGSPTVKKCAEQCEKRVLHIVG